MPNAVEYFVTKSQDIEQGFANSIPTEEVINILVQSYKSSDICQKVQREVAQIRKQVSFFFFVYLLLKNTHLERH